MHPQIGILTFETAFFIRTAVVLRVLQLGGKKKENHLGSFSIQYADTSFSFLVKRQYDRAWQITRSLFVYTFYGSSHARSLTHCLRLCSLYNTGQSRAVQQRGFGSQSLK